MRPIASLRGVRVIRSAAAFGASRVVLLGEAAHPFLPKVCRAAGTSLLKIPLLSGPKLRDIEDRDGLFSLSMTGKDLGRFAFPGAFGLLAGLEGQGLPERFRCGKTVRIPMENECESLNAAASIAVALYAWRSSNK